jgi:predicted nucleotidyltransferase
MDPIIQKCKEILEKHYGERFAGLILYGSQARGQAEEGSDIDMLVLLQGPLDYFQEIWNLAELLYPRQLQPLEIGFEEQTLFHHATPWRCSSKSKWSTRLGHTGGEDSQGFLADSPPRVVFTTS